MSAYWSLISYAPSDVELVMVDGEPFDPWVMVGKDLGSPAWEHQYAGARGTRGQQAAPGSLPNRQVAFTFLGSGMDKDDAALLLSQLSAMVDRCRRYGGEIAFREHGQTYKNYFVVASSGITVSSWGDNESEVRDAYRPAVVATVEPYAYGDHMHFVDDFTRNRLDTDHYTVLTGAFANLSVANRRGLGAANLATENRFLYSASGYELGDQGVRISFAPGGTLSGFKVGVVLKYIDSQNYIEAYVSDNGANTFLYHRKVEAGVATNITGPTALTRLVANDGRLSTVQCCINGNITRVRHWGPGVDPVAGVVTNEAISIPFTGTAVALFGESGRGDSGLLFTPQSTTAQVTDFYLEPYFYPGVGRRSVDVEGDIPGDAPAVADLLFTAVGSTYGPTTKPEFGMFAWSPRPTVHNRITNWGLMNNTVGYQVAAVAGVTGAASSLSQITTDAKLGHSCLQVVCPATANTGVSYPIYRRFKAGTTYTISAWVKSDAQTTLSRLRFGASGNITSESASALSTTWTKRTITFVSGTDLDLAYFVFEITAATATTFKIDGVLVYEGTVEPDYPDTADSGSPAFGLIDPLDPYTPSSGGSGIDPAATADALAEHGFFARTTVVIPAGGSFLLNYFPINPDTIPPDDYAGEDQQVEVWARVLLNTAHDGGITARASLIGHGYTPGPNTGEVTIPRATTNSGYRLCRLGTLTLPRAGDGYKGCYLQVKIVFGAGTNLQYSGIDHLWLVNPNARCCTPTAKVRDSTIYPADGVYPSMWTISSNERGARKTIRSDLSARQDLDVYSNPEGSLAGAPIELPTGRISILFALSCAIPDDPNSVVVDVGTTTADLALRVRPRWHYLRTA